MPESGSDHTCRHVIIARKDGRWRVCHIEHPVGRFHATAIGKATPAHEVRVDLKPGLRHRHLEPAIAAMGRDLVFRTDHESDALVASLNQVFCHLLCSGLVIDRQAGAGPGPCARRDQDTGNANFIQLGQEQVIFAERGYDEDAVQPGAADPADEFVDIFRLFVGGEIFQHQMVPRLAAAVHCADQQFAEI